ncbi:DUF1761 domain-containing protein [Shimia sp. CNT1-13L.2]|uniref:DUF1761 domain-containing protein n=1 Tax=Shimia sp. CNT1-13L.2 TaxID=2959663 RepID=UPI0020CDA7B0|nr:DUF1761 domain-containing protein [Shimia sp. CNT1-13L.2]MCP9482648.1 DUF1761 domain-containing protein [Shimia sp. CNT1-13L.2]
MEFISVIAAAIASYVFGAVWYMALGRPWMQAAGITPDENGRPPNSGALPYIVAFICAIFVAGMMRHVFALGGIASPGAGLIGGLGIGLFLATPWIATNYSFAGRPRALILIDGGYATIGCTLMGLVLTLL